MPTDTENPLRPPACVTCGREDESFVLYDERAYCGDCCQSCDGCGEDTPADLLTIVRGGECLCDSCAGTCDHCCATLDASDLENDLCDLCGAACADCGERRVRDDLDSCGLCGDCQCICPNCRRHFPSYDEFDGDYCEGCSPGLVEDNPPSPYIHEYGYRPMVQRFREEGEKTGPDTMYLGVEVETEAPAGRTKGDDVRDMLTGAAWYAKEDGSLVNGVEMVSHPATYAWWGQEEAIAWMKGFRRAGYKSYETTTCGMHVHVSRAGLSKGALYRLLEFVKQNRRELTVLSRRKPENLERWAAMDNRDTRDLVRKARYKAGVSRYEAINVVPNHTVEFRFFRGTLDEEGFRRNLDLVWAVCQFVTWSGRRGLAFQDFAKWLHGKASRPFLKEKNADRLNAWFVDLNIITRKDVVCA